MAFSRYLLGLVFLGACTAQKKTATTDVQLADNLKSHISYLADDKLEGRRAGSEGERLAMEYISGQFKAIGLSALPDGGYYQPFDIQEGKQVNAATRFTVGAAVLENGRDYFPFAYSASTSLQAKPAIAIQEHGQPWFYDLKDVLEENKQNPHFDLQDYIYNNAKKAKERGASAVLLYNTAVADDKLVFNGKDKHEALSIPVLYVNKPAAKKYFNDPSATLDIDLTTDIGEKKRTGHNVIGHIDNGAATTVILGAHFDHLGYGEDGNSTDRSGVRAIHNGADDNASGTAALIELARILKTSKAKNNNYVFIAFSGEELGLYGSKHYVEHPSVDLKTVSYMINMDMVGRFNDSTRVLTIGGIGTSPVWGEVLASPSLKESFVFKYDSSGTGPSDHTSFYRKDIPVLFYFTGLHTDYHKPSDDADKINYKGETAIIRHIYQLIGQLNEKGKPAFTKTREMQTSTNASFRVTLGIMPDYTFAGTGVRADGVTEGRPAAKAGLKAGDVIVKLGEYNITSMESYMQTLGKFEKGQKTTVKYKRGNELLEATIEF